jgi:hypothetical protein
VPIGHMVDRAESVRGDRITFGTIDGGPSDCCAMIKGLNSLY